MRSRGLIGILALMGVLLHAGALVRHNGVMLNALLQYQALAADLTAICHGAGTASDAELPTLPRPTSVEFGCPICAGVATAFALPPLEVSGHPVPPQRAEAEHRDQTSAPTVAWRQLPPARAPPDLS